MRELETVQKQEKLNKVFAIDEKGNGGANHVYLIIHARDDDDDDDDEVPANTTEITFQHGARKEQDSISGVLDNDLIEIVRDRINAFQGGEFPSQENVQVLHHIEQALVWMNKRVENRIKRNALGTNQK